MPRTSSRIVTKQKPGEPKWGWHNWGWQIIRKMAAMGGSLGGGVRVAWAGQMGPIVVKMQPRAPLKDPKACETDTCHVIKKVRVHFSHVLGSLSGALGGIWATIEPIWVQMDSIVVQMPPRAQLNDTNTFGNCTYNFLKKVASVFSTCFGVLEWTGRHFGNHFVQFARPRPPNPSPKRPSQASPLANNLPT